MSSEAVGEPRPQVLRSIRTAVLLLAIGWLMPRSSAGQFATAPDDPNVYPKPRAPALPAAGGSYVDPTFGTTIVRITDPSIAPRGASVNSAAIGSMFNADASMFYLSYSGGFGWYLYSLDRRTNRAAVIERLPIAPAVAYDGAAWDPVDPSILYAIVVGARNRTLYQITLPAGTMTALHDFSNEVAKGGYPYSRIQISPDARYFAVLVSTRGGQDTYDHAVVWDRQTDTSVVLDTASAMDGALLHALHIDCTGNYLIFESGDYRRRWIWHWPTNTLSPTLSVGPPSFFGGHIIPGWGEVLHPGAAGGTWVRRPLDDPTTYTPYLRYPSKNSKADWFEDSHSSRLLEGERYVQSRYVTTFMWGTFARYSGSIYKLSGFVATSADFDVPEIVRYKGSALTNVSGVPSAPGQWSYDPAADSVYLWLPDGSDPEDHRNAIAIFDWRPLMEEVVQFVHRGDGKWSWRRLAHHRMQYTGQWDDSPRGNVDPTGSFVLFQSNWDNTLRNADGSPRRDVFMIVAGNGDATGGDATGSAPIPAPTPVPNTTPASEHHGNPP